MGTRLVSSLGVIVCISLITIALSASIAPPDQAPDLVKNFGNIPLRFEQNMGQYPSDVHFISRSSKSSSLITNRGLILSNKNIAKTPIEIQFEGIKQSNPEGEHKLTGTTNYFIGNDEKKWIRDVPLYEHVISKEIYSGIDVKYHNRGSLLEYDFIVQPNANFNDIRFKINYADSVLINEEGSLEIRSNGELLFQHKPFIYQEIDDKKIEVSGKYKLLSENTVALAISEFNRDYPLVIDPVLEFSTHHGGIDQDLISDIALDSTGNIYVTGATSSTTFPTVNPAQAIYAGGSLDAFVTKLSPDGSSILYSTYIGGSYQEGAGIYNVEAASRAGGIAVNAQGEAFIVGFTDSDTDFPTVNALQPTYGGADYDGYFAKLNSAGNALVFSTYIGGEGADFLHDVEVDSAGNAIAVGKSNLPSYGSPEYPTTAGVVQPNRDTTYFAYDGVITKLDTNGAMVFSTFLGGETDDVLYSIELDASDNIYVTGYTDSLVNLPLVNAPQTTVSGGWFNYDIYVAKLNATASTVDFATYWGGSNKEFGRGITVDGNGKIIVTGDTESVDFPMQSPYQASSGGDVDAVVFKMSPSGTVDFSTYIGDVNIEFGWDVEVDSSNKIYVSGTTHSPNFPEVSPLTEYNTTTTGTGYNGSDVFISQFSEDGSTLSFSSKLGGNQEDHGFALEVTPSNGIYIAGRTDSWDFFTTPGALQPLIYNWKDGFIVKLQGDNAAPPEVSITAPIDNALVNDDTPTINLSFIDNGDGIDVNSVEVEINSSLVATTCTGDSASATCTPDNPITQGAATISVTVADNSGVRSDPDQISVTIDSIGPAITISNPLNNSFTNQESLIVSGQVNEAVTSLSVNGNNVTPDGAGNFSSTLTLTEGANTVTVIATDLAANQTTEIRSVTLDTVIPDSVDLGLVDISDVDNNQVTVTGSAGAAEGNTFVIISNTTTGASITVSVNADGSFTGQISASAGDNISVKVADAAGNESNAINHTSLAINLPPTLTTVADQSIAPGSTLTIQLQATDPENATLTFTASPQPLPENSSLNAATGEFKFSPRAEQVGTFNLTFFVSDGVSSDSDAVQITVTAINPGDPTTFTATLLDANSFDAGQTVPIVGATLSFLNTGISAVSDANGVITINNAPSGDQVLDIDTAAANNAPDGSTYAGFREKFVLIANVDNQVDRPFYLPRIDASSLTTVDPNATTMVVNSGLGIELEVPPNTAKDESGNNFTGELSISMVPKDLAPAPLPEDIDPGMLITIQPVGVTFDTPVPITFPNTDNLAPGNEVDIWSLDPQNGEFIVVGVGEVSADGTEINTISGGIIAADWHAPLGPGTENSENNETPNETEDPCNQSQNNSGSTVQSKNGCVGTGFNLPEYFSQGQRRGLSFSYKSQQAYPKRLIPFDLTIPRRSAVPPQISYQLEVSGIDLQQEAYIDTTGLSESVDETLRAVAVFDASEAPTGYYPYDIKVTNHFSANTRRSSRVQGRLPIINKSASEFGAGWGINGLSRLYTSEDDRILIEEGDGSYSSYEPRRVDLSQWTHEGGAGSGDWELSANNLSVEQVDNGNPTFYISPIDQIDTTIKGRMRVETTSDDDFIGFVLGYKTPLSAFGNDPLDYDFYLFDWRQADQTNTGGTFGPEGFTLSYINQLYTTAGSLGDAYNAIWGHQTANGVTLLATDYGADKGWVDNQWYDFEVQYFSNRITILIDDEVIFNVNGSFPAGRFGFFNQSQPDVRYELLTNPDGLVFEGTDGDFSTVAAKEDGTYTRTLKNGTRINFDADGFQTSVVDRNGNTTTYAYNVNQQLETVTDPVGKVTTLAYSGNNLSSVTDPANRVTEFMYDSNGNLVQVLLPDGTTKSFGYDENHLMTSETDRRGNTVFREYDVNGRLIQTQLPDGAIRQATNAQSVGFIDLSSGQGTQANPAPFVRPDAAQSSFIDGENHTSTVKTDRYGQALEKTDANNLTTMFERDADGNATKITRPDSSIIEQTFDDKGNLLTRKELFNNAETINTYDPLFSLITSITDPRGNVTTYTRDGNGNLTQLENDLNQITTWTYNTEGLIETRTDANGVVTTYTYTAEDLIATMTETPPTGGGATRVTSYEYDSAGNITKITTPDSIVIDMTYDEFNRRVTLENNLGEKITTTFDEAGNVDNTVTMNPDDSKSSSTTQSYDALNRLLETLMPHDINTDASTQRSYDLAGNLTDTTDAKGNSASMSYDDGNRLLTETDRDNGVTQYQYDDLGNINQVIAPNGVTTSYAYDALSRQTNETSPDRGALTYTYDLANNLATVTDARGIIATYIYDDLNRITQITYPDATENVTFTYDNCTFGVGRLCSRSDESGSYNFTYDAYSNITQQEFVSAVTSFTTSYTYDAGHQLTQMVLPSGRVVDYTRDAVQRISGINATINGTQSSIVSNIAYNADNQVTARTYGNGLVDTRSYDLQNRLLQQSTGTVDNVSYSYDLNGNVLTRNPTTVSHSYSYDVLDRIIGDTLDLNTTNYTYDANHNRLTANDGTQTTNYTVTNNSNRLASINTTSISYDANGNIIDDGSGRTYTYNDTNRLEQVVDNSVVTATYTYNAAGQRKIKTTSSDTIVYHYDLSGNVVSETTTAGSGIKDYIWQGTDPVAQINAIVNDEVTYLHADHLATPRLGTNSAGTITWRWESEAFGNTSPDEDPDGDTINTTVNLRFLGQYFDIESELHYNYFRNYDPLTGRYTQSDPIGLFGGVNTYLYALANPAQYVDPYGLNSQSDSQDSNDSPQQCDSDEDDCAQEWEDAYERCRQELYGPNRGITGNYTNMQDCARGLVSERCGGNKVDYGKQKSRNANRSRSRGRTSRGEDDGRGRGSSSNRSSSEGSPSSPIFGPAPIRPFFPIP